MDPNNVFGPKAKIEEGSVNVIFGDANSDFSIAIMKWDGNLRVGMRWNGKGTDKGYPRSGRFGHPQWFIIPKALALAYANDKKDIRMVEIIEATTDESLK